MTFEPEQKLFGKYPKLFAQRNMDIMQTCMCWGVECGDGWYDLIDNLCGTIQSYIDMNHKPQMEFVQVKEKFGTLRLYTNGAEDELIRGMIWFAEELSGKICEVCGKPGTINNNGWISCLCEEHRKVD